MIFDYHSSPSAHTLFSTRRKQSAKPPKPRGSGGFALLVLLQLAEVVIGFDGFRREGIVLPPADKGGCHGQAGGDQLLQLGRLDGQHRVAGGAEDLIGQRQRQRGGAGDGGGCDLVVHKISFRLCWAQPAWKVPRPVRLQIAG